MYQFFNDYPKSSCDIEIGTIRPKPNNKARRGNNNNMPAGGGTVIPHRSRYSSFNVGYINQVDQ